MRKMRNMRWYTIIIFSECIYVNQTRLVMSSGCNKKEVYIKKHNMTRHIMFMKNWIITMMSFFYLHYNHERHK